VTEGRILGLDYGRKRIGVAISDPLKITAQSLPTLIVTTWEQVLSDILTIVQERSVSHIIVGMPLHLKGAKGETALEVEKFIAQMKTTISVPVTTWDERWTSLVAQQTLIDMGKSPSRHRGKVDQIAAQLILQNYLDYLSMQRVK